MLHELQRREREVAELVARGYCDEAIAQQLGMTRASAHTYVQRLYEKLGLPKWTGKNQRVLLARLIYEQMPGGGEVGDVGEIERERTASGVARGRRSQRQGHR